MTTLINQLSPASFDVVGFFGSAKFGPDAIAFFLIFVIISVLKCIALWKAGSRGEKKWFVALFVINTLGILELLYIFYFSKRNPKSL